MLGDGHSFVIYSSHWGMLHTKGFDDLGALVDVVGHIDLLQELA
jgi:hypothetical protein